MMKQSKTRSKGGVHARKGPRKRGRSKRWRAKMRARAEAKAAARKKRRLAAGLGLAVVGDDAAARFAERRRAMRACYGTMGEVVHLAAWLLHNCVAHPLLGVLPCAWTIWLHDRTADWLNLSPVATRSDAPVISSRMRWLVHNCIAHPVMGVAPGARAFARHEQTAERMGVEGWV